MAEAVGSYVNDVLAHRRDESRFIGSAADGPTTEEFEIGTIFGD